MVTDLYAVGPPEVRHAYSCSFVETGRQMILVLSTTAVAGFKSASSSC